MTARRVGQTVLAGAIAVVLGHGWLFAHALPTLSIEAEYGALGVVARLSSLVFAALAVLSAAWLGRRVSGDAPTGAFLALGLVLFPPVTALWSLATPHAAVTALLMTGLACLWPGDETAPRRDLFGLACLAIATVIDGNGAKGATCAALLLLWLRPTRRLWLAAAAAAAAGVAFGSSPDAADSSLIPIGKNAVLFGAILPFGMIWVAAVFSALAARSRTVRDAMGWRAIAGCLAASAFFAALIAQAGGGPNSLAAGGYFLPFGIVGALPFVVWVRRAMPQITHIGAWLAFPVIMYSCFWVVLGPVKPDRFPYMLLHKKGGQSQNSSFYSDPFFVSRSFLTGEAHG